jgi:predicted transcriptional regulator
MGEWGKDDISLSSQMPNNFSLRVNQLTSEMTSAFSNMCTRLIAITAQKKIIQERTLLDFNRFVIFTITNNITQLPNSFCELSTRIADYWHYELDRETDSDRKYSYIRLYQMIDTVNAFYAEQHIQQKALKAVNKQRKNKSIVYLIQQHPGITYRSLLATLPIPPTDLQDQLQELESDGFLYGRHSNNERYFMLTNAGDVLYQALITPSGRALDGYWGNSRTKILVYLLEILGSKNIRISSVLKYVHTLAECDDVKVDTFWNQILNRRTRSFMWNIRGVTEYESFSFIMEPTHFNMSKLNNPSQLDPEDIKVVLSLHNDSYRTNSNIYNHVEEKQSLLNTI